MGNHHEFFNLLYIITVADGDTLIEQSSQLCYKSPTVALPENLELQCLPIGHT